MATSDPAAAAGTAAAPVICLVSIHGIGFEQPPAANVPGYADSLHAGLKTALPELLGDDPIPAARGQRHDGPIYVEGSWPPESASAAHGLDRLGTWRNVSRRDEIDTSRAPLADGDHRIVHVALVYSREQDRSVHLGAVLWTAANVGSNLFRYGSLRGIVTYAVNILRGMRRAPAKSAAPTPSLRLRSDAGYRLRKRRGQGAALPGGTDGGASPVTRPRGAALTGPVTPPDRTDSPPGAVAPPVAATAPDNSGLFTVLRTIDDDLAAYVSYNGLRTRVRDFVREALWRLAARDDVAGIVVNAHSNGTTIAFDVLRELPPDAADCVSAFVTSGSPLRKYTAFFRWGTQVDRIGLKPWTNYWDLADPVSDPLRAPERWRRGDSLPGPAESSALYVYTDPETGQPAPAKISDVAVDNVGHTGGGGLRAHNYWDNQQQFVSPLADTLRAVLAQATTLASSAPAGMPGPPATGAGGEQPLG